MTQAAFVGHGTRFVTTNGAPTPPLPAGLADGDLLLAVIEIHSSIRTYTAPEVGWTYLGAVTNTGGPSLYFHWKRYSTGDTDPTFATTGASDASKSVLAKVLAWRNADVTAGPVLGTAYTSGATTGSNAGPIPGVAVTGAGLTFLVGAWNDDYSSIPATPAGFTLIVNDEVTSTNGISLHFSYLAVTNATSSAQTITGHPSAVATRSGVQVAINEASTTFTGTLAVTGSGSVTFGGTPAPAGSLARTGSGSLSLSGGPGGALTRTGSGLLSLAASAVVTAGTLARTGSGTVTFGATIHVNATLTVTGSGSLSFGGTPRPAGSLARTGSGSLSLSGVFRALGTMARTGSGQLSLSGRAVYRHQVWKEADGVWREIVPEVAFRGAWLAIPVKLHAPHRGA